MVRLDTKMIDLSSVDRKSQLTTVDKINTDQNGFKIVQFL